MSKSTQAQAAAIIRKHIKAHGIKARVRSSSASMMTAIDVDVTDLPPWAARELESYVRRFQYGHFDGMQDLYEYSNRDDSLPQVKYTQVHNTMSDDMRADIEAWIDSFYAPGHDISAWQVFGDDRNWGREFWLARKPRALAA